MTLSNFGRRYLPLIPSIERPTFIFSFYNSQIMIKGLRVQYTRECSFLCLVWKVLKREIISWKMGQWDNSSSICSKSFVNTFSQNYIMKTVHRLFLSFANKITHLERLWKPHFFNLSLIKILFSNVTHVKVAALDKTLDMPT